MRAIRATLLPVGLLCLLPAATAQVGLENPDFERDTVGQPPRGWFVPTPGYTAAVTETRPHRGQRCARLSSDDTDDQAPFGNIMQTVDATPYRGRRVRLRAAVRVAIAGFEDQAQLWLRVDRAGGQMGFFDNMGDRPIRVPGWKYYQIIGDVANDAETVNFGLMLCRNGQVWLDDVSLEVLTGPSAAPVEGPRPLKGRALRNLVALTRLLGYVRHFHPSDEADETSWDDLAIVGVRTVEVAKDPSELARRLEQIFRPIAPTVRVFPTGRRPPAPPGLSPLTHVELPQISTWQHLGVQLGKQRGPYRSKRVRAVAPGGEVPEDVPDPREPLFADLGGGVSCLVPLALWADQGGTLPQAAAKLPAGYRLSLSAMKTGNDRATRLAAVMLSWNVFQHFYPYFDVVDTDWAAVLRTTLAAAATDRNERAFLDTLRRMIAELHDGHGNVIHASDTRSATLPLLWDWIEGRLVVTRVDESVAPDALKPGDVVLKIAGREAADALADAEQLVSAATDQWKRFRGLRELARGKPGEMVTLEVQGIDGQVQAIALRQASRAMPLEESRPAKVADVRLGVMYVDLSRITEDDFKQALPRLEKARGIVFDLRGYPNKLSTIVVAHLIDEPVTCAQWHVPKVTRPDRQKMEYRFSNWKVEPQEPRLMAKVAFVTDGRAISYAETYLGIIEHYQLAEIVGGPTAGTNGNVNPFTLPGGYRVVWTGMRVLKHDGSRHHGVGIRPTVPVSRTIEGVRAGRDELLEKAIEVVSPEAPGW